MPTKIKPDYKPRPRVAELLAVRYPELTVEQAAEFIGHELPEFIMFWQNTGKPMSDWDSTCLNRMKNLYAWKKEKQAGTHMPSQGDIFQKAFIGIDPAKPGADKTVEAEVSISKGKISYRILSGPIPGADQTMNTEDALEQLRKINLK